jgi:hypothetical protein
MLAPGSSAPVCPFTPVQPTACPPVMSFRAVEPMAYSSGLTNPSGRLPARRRASFRRARIPATTGAAADVPPEGDSWPS